MPGLVSSPSRHDIEWLLNPPEGFLYQSLEVDTLRWYQWIDRLVNSDEPTERHAEVGRENLMFFSRQGGRILLKIWTNEKSQPD
jgi:hypothetical protein